MRAGSIRCCLALAAANGGAAFTCSGPYAFGRAVVHSSSFRTASARVRCQEGDEEMFQVCLRDPDDGRSIECTMLETLETETDLFASMTPVDVAAVVATLQDNEMIEVDDPEIIEQLMPTATAVCSERGLSLLDSAVTLTISGNLQDIDEVGLFEGEEDLSTMPELVNADEAEEDEEGAEAVLSFFHEGRKYYLMRLLEPLVLVGKQVSASTFEIPDEKEMAAVSPVLEGLMEDAMADAELFDGDDDDNDIGI
mmetsp:Transcript_15064/g.32727  ORF Transcript_15064/g.32727 Transcript_15064/m.32727 type:complete len:253 (-) Transcript_15064:227-985(-)